MTTEDENYLDKEFPKGKTKFRGQAMVLLALARQEGQQAEQKRILEIIDEDYRAIKVIVDKLGSSKDKLNAQPFLAILNNLKQKVTAELGEDKK